MDEYTEAVNDFLAANPGPLDDSQRLLKPNDILKIYAMMAPTLSMIQSVGS